MSHEPSLKEVQQRWHGSLSSYLYGFISSLLFTLAAFFIVFQKLLTGKHLTITLWALGLVQAVAQFLFFLHLGKESKPKWNLSLFCFMAFTLLIIVMGSLWIMHNLDVRMMSYMEMGKDD